MNTASITSILGWITCTSWEDYSLKCPVNCNFSILGGVTLPKSFAPFCHPFPTEIHWKLRKLNTLKPGSNFTLLICRIHLKQFEHINQRMYTSKNWTLQTGLTVLKSFIIYVIVNGTDNASFYWWYLMHEKEDFNWSTIQYIRLKEDAVWNSELPNLWQTHLQAKEFTLSRDNFGMNWKKFKPLHLVYIFYL